MRYFSIKYYPIKVWLTTILAASLLQSVFILIYHDFTNYTDFFPGLFDLILFSFLFSLPSFFLYYLVLFFLQNYKTSNLLRQTLGAGFAILCLLITYYFIHDIMGGDLFHPKTLFFLIIYSICIVLFSFLYKLS